LNKERNFRIEAVKKDWYLTKASHYKLRDQNPALRFPFQQYQKEQLIDYSIPMPIIGKDDAKK